MLILKITHTIKQYTPQLYESRCFEWATDVTLHSLGGMWEVPNKVCKSSIYFLKSKKCNDKLRHVPVLAFHKYFIWDIRELFQ